MLVSLCCDARLIVLIVCLSVHLLLNQQRLDSFVPSTGLNPLYFFWEKTGISVVAMVVTFPIVAVTEVLRHDPHHFDCDCVNVNMEITVCF